MAATLPLLLACALSLTTALAAVGYSWDFAAVPAQCGTLALNITGDGGAPPFRALVIPYGSSPFAHVEVRRLFEVTFNDSSHLSVPLNYPAGSQFVITVSDATGFGTGGTSAANIVQPSSDSNCFNSTQGVKTLFWTSINPQYLAQCHPTRIYWDPSQIQGTPQFHGVIPGGNAFTIPVGKLTNESGRGYGTGFDWAVPVSVGTEIVVLASDNRGYVGGSIQDTVAQGSSAVSSCLNDSSPVSTSGRPAGGVYPTFSSATTGSSTSSTTTGSPTSSATASIGATDGHRANVRAITGGAISGAAMLLALVLLVLVCRRRRVRQPRGEDLTGGEVEPLWYFRPESFVPISAGPPARRSTPKLGRGLESSSLPQIMSGPVNGPPAACIIQHDDGGCAPHAPGEPEVLELPPAYADIRRASRPRTPATSWIATPVMRKGPGR